MIPPTDFRTWLIRAWDRGDIYVRYAYTAEPELFAGDDVLDEAYAFLSTLQGQENDAGACAEFIFDGVLDEGCEECAGLLYKALRSESHAAVMALLTELRRDYVRRLVQRYHIEALAQYERDNRRMSDPDQQRKDRIEMGDAA